MKSIITKIYESIAKLPEGQTGIIVFDIDDTLLQADGSVISIYKNAPGKEEVKMTTAEFAKDPDAADPKKKSWFEYRDFRDNEKVYKSIVKGTPLVKNLRIMDSYLDAGYEFCFLTARACEEVIKDAIGAFLKVKQNDGTLKEIGSIFNRAMSHAINDEAISYEGNSDADKKANILKDICSKYDRVVFVDDDTKNVKAARQMGLKNLKVISAWK